MDLDTITYRAAMHTRALSTLGGSQEWDRALTKFLARYALWQASAEFGPYERANETFAREKMELEAAFGRDWKSNELARERGDANFAVLRAAEQAHEIDILGPMWAAEVELVRIPAPTLNAALFKVELIAAEEVWNDGALEQDAFALVAQDLARFA